MTRLTAVGVLVAALLGLAGLADRLVVLGHDAGSWGEPVRATAGSPPGPPVGSPPGVVPPPGIEPNVGQAGPGAAFVLGGPGAGYLTWGGGVVLPIRSGPPADGRRGATLRITPAGSEPEPAVAAIDPLRANVSYLIGPRPAGWHAGVPTYGEVLYRGLYPGIDLRYRADRKQLEYDFDLRAHADPRRIAIDLVGARSVRIDRDGNLRLRLGATTVEQRRPTIYQLLGGRRVGVPGGYRLLGASRVGFKLGHYDLSRALVIDPSLVYSTQLAGSAPGEAEAIAVDRFGNTYLAGETDSANLPTRHPIQPQPKSRGQTAFVTKLNRQGAIVYSTYLGGSLYTDARGIAVDAAGNAYVTGATNSTDLPTTAQAYQRSYGGGPFDAFVTKLNSAGTRIVYSTFLGSTHYDEGNAIVVDRDGRAVVTGKTVSPDFPLRDHLSPITTSGAFVTKLNRSGSGLVSSTVFGGDGAGGHANHGDAGYGIALDPTGDIYVTGETSDPTFPVVAPLQAALGGSGNAFVIKLDAAMTRVLYATYLGGSGDDIGRGIAADAVGDAYVAGQTTSRDFPTARPLQPAVAGPGPQGADAFVAELDPAGHALVFSTYIGGSADDGAFGVAVDRSHDVYIAGQTASPDFPLVAPIQRRLKGPSDAFLTKLDRSGSLIAFSTYFGGGGGGDAALGIALDRFGEVHFDGQTDSADFPRRVIGRGSKRYLPPGDGAFAAVLGSG